MKHFAKAKYIVLAVVAAAGLALFSVPAAHASGYAQLRVNFHYPDGSAAGVSSYTIHSEHNYEVISTTGYPSSYDAFQNAATRSASTGSDTLNYGSDLVLNCQVSSGTPYYDSGAGYWMVGNISAAEHFYIDSASTPAGVGSGHWAYPNPHFTVSNDALTSVDIYWVNDAPPPPPKGMIEGIKVINSDYGPRSAETDGAGVNVSYVAFKTDNPFFFPVDQGNYQFTAQTIIGNWKLDHIAYSTNSGASWVDVPANAVNLTVGSGQTVDMRVVYVPNNGVIEGIKILKSTNYMSPDIDSAPVIVDAASNTSTANPFYYREVSPGNHYFVAPSPYNGYIVDHLLYSIDAGATWTYVAGNSMGIQVNPGLTVDLRVVYAFDDVSSCTSPRVGNPTQVAAGGSFNFNVAYGNSGSHTWTSPTYRGAAYLQTGRTDVPFPPGSVIDAGTTASPQYSYMDQFSVPRYSTAYFDTSSSPSNTFTFNAPSDPGTYWINTSMVRAGDEHFSYVCSYPIKVVRLYDYIPSIGASSGSKTIPAANNGGIVTPGTSFALTETIKNRTVTPNNIGDDYNWSIKAYSGSYTTGATSVSFGPDILVGPIPAGAPETGVMANGTKTHTANYFVPANTPDGTQICFYASVAPAARTNVNSVQPDVASRYSDYADYGTNPNAADNNANIRTSYAPGNMVSNDLCVEVVSLRKASLQVQQGDVHAGGGIGTGCTAPAAGTGNITGNYGSSYAEYVTSANGTINGFGSGGAPTSALTLLNTGGGGQYGYICRPDLASIAASYPINHPTTSYTLGTNTVNLTGLPSGFYTHSGSLTINGGTISVDHRVTIFNTGDVTINGNIAYSTAPANLTKIPSFGLITGSGGNIKISKDVTEVDGFYVASNSTPTSNDGYIDTCYQHDTFGPSMPSHITSDCPDALNVLGSLTGHHLYFWRTGLLGSNQNTSVITENVRQSGILFLAPPPGFETQSNSPYALPQYGGETSPLY